MDTEITETDAKEFFEMMAEARKIIEVGGAYNYLDTCRLRHGFRAVHPKFWILLCQFRLSLLLSNL